MKTATILAVMGLCATTTLSGAEEISDDEFCGSMGKVAATIMTSRQMGMPMSDVIKLAPDALIRKLVEIAYGMTRYSTEEFRARAVDDFRNIVELKCYKDRSKK